MLKRIDATQEPDAPVRNKPRAVVIGAGFGGLAAAMRLGAKGYKVTVLDRLDQVGGRASSITENGHRFDLGPTIVTAPGLLRDLWRCCGREFDNDVDLVALDPFYEIRFHDGSSFSASGDSDRMRAEVARLSPNDVPGYQRFLEDSARRYEYGFEVLGRRPMHRLPDLLKALPKFAALRADRSIHAHAARRFRDERLRMAFSFHPLFIGGNPFRVTSMYALVAHLEKTYGVHYAQGGTGAIAKAMQRVAEAQGTEFRLGEEVAGIEFSGNRVSGARTAEGTVIRANVVVSNADAGHTYDRLLSARPRKRWTPKRLERSRWSMGLFVWYFGTRGTRSEWPDVGHHTILNGPRYRGLLDDIFLRGRLAEDMSLYVHRPSVTDPSAAPPGDDTFYALSPVPHLGFPDPIDWANKAKGYLESMKDMLEAKLLPGLRKRLSASMVFTPDDFRDRYLSPYGCGFSLEPRILQSAWFRPHNLSEEIEGLFLVGAGTHPGAGLPGVIASAEVLAQMVPEPDTVQ